MIADRQFEKQEHSSVKLTVSVTPEGAAKAYDEMLTKYGRNAQIPGFRKGKVPREVLVRKFGEGIRVEAAGELIDSALKQVLDETDKAPISQPTLEDLPAIEPGKPYEFTVTYDVFPEITLSEYRGIPVQQPQVKIGKADEAAELETIRERNAVVIDKKDGKVSENAVVTMDWVELGDDDLPVEESRRRGFVFTVGRNPHPLALEKDIEGMTAGESKVIEKTYPEDAPSPVAGRRIRLNAAITAVKERELPDIDDELAQDVSDDLKTLDDLKKKIRTDLEERAAQRVRIRMINSITDKLVEGAVIDLPESMVREDLERTWQDYVRQSGAPEDMLIRALEDDGRSKADILAGWRTDAEKSIRTRLIYGRIVENEKIGAENDEIETELKKRAVEFRMPPEELEKMFGGPQFREYLRNELVQKKLFDFLLEVASVKKGEKIDYNELMGA